MALRLLGDGVVQRGVSSVVYSPGLADSGDLEPGTRSVSATSRPPSPDYSANLTLPAPPDPRLQVLRLGLRVRVNIAGWGGNPAATTLFYAVRVNGSDRLSGSWTTTGTQTVADDLPMGSFNLGPPNLVELFLWADRGFVDVTLAQFWLAVGSRQTAGNLSGGVLQLQHRGLLSLAAQVDVAGGGSPSLAVAHPQLLTAELALVQGVAARLRVPALLAENPLLLCYGTLASDLNYLRSLAVAFEEQG
jgi:hypothetical protein